MEIESPAPGKAHKQVKIVMQQARLVSMLATLATLASVRTFTLQHTAPRQHRTAVARRAVQRAPLYPVALPTRQRMARPPMMRYIGGGIDPRGLVGPAVFALLLFTGGLGWVFNLLNGIFLIVFVLPLLVGPIINWYVRQNLLEGTCPECGAPVQLFKGQQGQCVYCGACMSSELSPSKVFMRTSTASTQRASAART